MVLQAISKRNTLATLFPLVMPVFFCFIAFVLGVDDRHNENGFNKATFDLQNPPTSWVTPLATCDTRRMPGCEVALALVGPLKERVVTRKVWDAILEANPHVIGKTAHYADTAELNEDLLANPQKVLAAVHFPDDFDWTKPEYILQYNQTRACLLGAFSCNDPIMDVGLPLQVAVEAALLQENASAGWSPA